MHVFAEVTRFLGEDTRKGIPDLVICDAGKRTVEIVMELKLDLLVIQLLTISIIIRLDLLLYQLRKVH